MTRADMRTLILGWLDDPNGTYFTSALLNTWINLAQRRVQLKLISAGQSWYEVPVETLTVLGQADYMLPSDFVVEHRIEIVLAGTGTNETVKPLQPITTMQRDQAGISQGVPSFYHMKKDRFTLSPVPQQQYTMRLWYSPRVADLSSDSDSPDVPEQYMEYCAIVAAYDGFVKDDRMPDVLMNKKDEIDKQLKDSSQQRTQDGPRRIIETQDLDGGGDFY